MRIEFNTDEFQLSVGHKPHGRGVWMFKVGEEEFEVPGSRVYTEAKKIAAAHVRSQYKRGAVMPFVKVLP